MTSISISPLVELTRGPLVESIHFGALVVVDSNGRQIASLETLIWLPICAPPPSPSSPCR